MNQTIKTLSCFGVALLCFAASVIAQLVTDPVTPPSPGVTPNIFVAMYETIIHNPASLFIIIVLSALAWLLDELPFVNSKFVTHYTAIIGASTYWLFAFQTSVPKSFPHPVAVLACIGFVCGFVAGILHKQLVARAIAYLRGRVPELNPNQNQSAEKP